jgi:hypothetical protein
VKASRKRILQQHRLNAAGQLMRPFPTGTKQLTRYLEISSRVGDARGRIEGTGRERAESRRAVRVARTKPGQEATQ